MEASDQPWKIGGHPLPSYIKRLVEVTASLEASNQPEDRRLSFAELHKEVSRGDGLAGGQQSTRGSAAILCRATEEVSRGEGLAGGQRSTRGSAAILYRATEKG